jgi:hypothetical protein
MLAIESGSTIVGCSCTGLDQQVGPIEIEFPVGKRADVRLDTAGTCQQNDCRRAEECSQMVRVDFLKRLPLTFAIVTPIKKVTPIKVVNQEQH